jgi:DNA-binding NarL/FixJ family response regulator
MIAPNAQVHVLQPYSVKHRTIHGPKPRLVTSDDAQRAQALRLAAIEADARATTQINVTLLWRELARGTTIVVDSFFSDERCYLVLALKAGTDATPLEGRRLEIAEAVLGAQPQKNIAADLGLAASTIALNARLALESIGVECKPSRAHPILMLAARSSRETKLLQASCSTFIAPDERELRVISVARPDQRLAPVLPPAELIVIRWLIEGLPYKEIAERRGTSTRTIANQITAVFRRLRVSGRNELVHRLFFEEGPSGAPARVNAETLAPLDTVEPKTMLELHAQRRSA